MNSKQVSQVHARNLIPGEWLWSVQVCVSKKLESGAGTEYEIKVLWYGIGVPELQTSFYCGYCRKGAAQGWAYGTAVEAQLGHSSEISQRLSQLPANERTRLGRGCLTVIHVGGARWVANSWSAWPSSHDCGHLGRGAAEGHLWASLPFKWIKEKCKGVV